ncbi:MmgE/PrpD family protein, partial [candidate division KSB1 bacterium]|nr:MmgE/PrpD family protein [candidate division KSB1 bacterium]NIS24841.1 MmgE/PrpD family protein [candidate division KSB1 bacterium]NIT71761.1 MmgE/PrpD family protein [candidate division KSB1 bacterium]NIU25481.1 MmgE/PrpD family protein [candidate division KSB1 bacterium]NIU89414.1 MmgE/PrpD family protein [candidate division KSB1 bacterium]
MNSISRQISKFAVALKYEDLPADVIEEVKCFLYDSVGCAFGGYTTHDVNIVRQIYSDMGGKAEATVIASGEKIPAYNATFLNSLMVRALDFNDIYWKQDPSHPSDLIPVALAVGERENKTAKAVIAAIVLAYEFECRLCEFAVPGIRERKWHHGTLTQFVSPIVAGYLLGLTEDQMVNAIGISGSHNLTLGAVTAGRLTMMKNTVDPLASQSGVMAALMAQRGYTGTEQIFEGKEGLMQTLGPDWDTDKLVSGLGGRFKILDCSMKAFPTEALTHSHISATLKAVLDNDIQPEDIKEVKVTTIARAVDILFDPEKYRPTSRETADHSLPYCIAAAIVDRKITAEQFNKERIKDPKIQRVLPKIKGEASEEFEKMFPEKQPSKVTIRLKSGEEHAA